MRSLLATAVVLAVIAATGGDARAADRVCEPEEPASLIEPAPAAPIDVIVLHSLAPDRIREGSPLPVCRSGLADVGPECNVADPLHRSDGSGFRTPDRGDPAVLGRAGFAAPAAVRAPWTGGGGEPTHPGYARGIERPPRA